MGLPMVALAAATAVKAYGDYSQGVAASKAAAYQAQVQEQNAKIARQNADFAGAEGNANVAAAQMKNAAQVANIKTAQAANGIDVNKGSAVGIQASQAQLGELDALNIRANAVRQAYGYQTQAVQAEGQAALDRATSKNAKTAAFIKGAGTLLSGASNAAMNYSDFQASKGFDATPASDDVTLGGGYPNG